MGYWGTAILSNDTSADIKDTFFDLYDKDVPLCDIRIEIEKEFKVNDKLADNTDFWLTLALLQWQTGCLDIDVKQFAEEIIDNDIDIAVWKDCDSDEKSLSKRKSELKKLKEKLQTENPKPRKRKKKKMPNAIFQKGEVYAFPMKNGKYTSFIVLEEILNLDYHYTLAANTDIISNKIPTLSDIANSNILVLPPHDHVNVNYRPLITSYLAVKYKEIIQSFIKIGDVYVKKDYKGGFINFGASSWSYMIESVNIYLVDNKERPHNKIKTKEYIKIKTPANIVYKILGFKWFPKFNTP